MDGHIEVEGVPITSISGLHQGIIRFGILFFGLHRSYLGRKASKHQSSIAPSW